MNAVDAVEHGLPLALDDLAAADGIESVLPLAGPGAGGPRKLGRGPPHQASDAAELVDGHSGGMQTIALRQADAPRVARLTVAQHCRNANTGPECADSAVLATSEVVTNTLVHGHGAIR